MFKKKKPFKSVFTLFQMMEKDHFVSLLGLGRQSCYPSPVIKGTWGFCTCDKYPLECAKGLGHIWLYRQSRVTGFRLVWLSPSWLSKLSILPAFGHIYTPVCSCVWELFHALLTDGVDFIRPVLQGQPLSFNPVIISLWYIFVLRMDSCSGPSFIPDLKSYSVSWVLDIHGSILTIHTYVPSKLPWNTA